MSLPIETGTQRRLIYGMHTNRWCEGGRPYSPRGAVLAGLMLGCLLVTAAGSLFPLPLRAEENEGIEARIESMLDEGRALFTGKRFGDAMRVLRRVLAMDPRNGKAYFLIGKIYLFTGKRERGLKCLYKAWRYSPDDLEIAHELLDYHMQVSSGLQRRGAVEAAARELEKPVRVGLWSYTLLKGLFRLYRLKRLDDRILKVWNRVRGGGWMREYPLEDTDQKPYVLYEVARVLNKKGEWREALALLSSIPDLDEVPGAKELSRALRRKKEALLRPLVEKAGQALRRGAVAEAMRWTRKASELAPGDDRVEGLLVRIKRKVEVDSLLKKARAMQKEGKLEEAFELLNRISELDPSNAEASAMLGAIAGRVAELRRKRREEAERSRKQAEEKNRRFSDLVEEGERAERNGDYLRALECYRKALGIYPGDAGLKERLRRIEEDALVQQKYSGARRLLAKGDYPGALKLLVHVKRKKPDYRGVKKLIARCYFETGQLEQALQYALEYEERHPHDPSVLYLIGRIYEEMGREEPGKLEHALEYYDKVYALDPEYEDVSERRTALYWREQYPKVILAVVFLLLWIGGWFFYKNRHRWLHKGYVSKLEKLASRGEWRKLRKMHPQLKEIPLEPSDEAKAHAIFAQAFFNTGAYNFAVKECQHVFRLKRETGALRLLYARAQYGMKNISQELLPYYLELIENEPDNDELLMFVGKFCARKKLINPTTMNILKRLVQLDPDDDALRSVLVKMFMKTGERGARVMAIFKAEKERNPANLEVRAAIAEELLKSGDVKGAIAECEEILNMDVNHKPTHEVLLRAYEKLGMLDQLVEIYRGILRDDPHNAVINYFLRRILHPEQEEVAPGNVEVGQVVDALDRQMPPEDGAGGEGGSAAGEGGKSGENGPVCPRCGKKVPIGAYYCSCGQPL